MSKVRTCLVKKLDKLDTRNDPNAINLENKCDAINVRNLECDREYDLCVYLQDKRDNLHEKHFLRTVEKKKNYYYFWNKKLK